MKNWVKESTRPDFSKIRGRGYVLQSLWSQWNRLTVQNDQLYRKFEEDDGNTTRLQAIVPISQRRTVLEFCHDVNTAAHLGVSKTLPRIRKNFYWPGLQADVRLSPMEIVERGVPMDRVATDILGELPTTKKGNKYLLVVSDYFTKWTECFPIPNMEAKTMAKLIVEEVFVRYGIPFTVHSDQGRQYESTLFEEMCKVLHIKKTRTTPYHPQSDDMVERFNKTLVTMLSAYVNDHHSDWDEHLPYVMMACRTSLHETTGFTPNQLMLGREVSTPLDIMYEMPRLVKIHTKTQMGLAIERNMETAHTFVRENI